ncbi:MAG TPA: hypothetical protein VFB49_13235 [Patescibacteria group bacterium]|nr:hypothetical protein [Patescibacteria group bacterium]
MIRRLRRWALCVAGATALAAAARGAAPPGPATAPPAAAPPAATAPPGAAPPAATPAPPPGAAAAAAPSKRLGPPDLRDQFQNAEKALRKADAALGGHDAGRVSLLLQRADEEILKFEEGSGLADFVRETGAARQAAAADDLTTADRAVRRARAASASLGDYSVARSAEVSYRAALAAVGDRSTVEFLAALDAMEAAVRAPLLIDRLHAARAAITRARSAMVRNDFPAGRKEVAAARTGLDGVTYLGTLSRSCYAFLAASELLHDRATLTARDQIQKGLHDLATAKEIAPPTDLEDIAAVHDQVVGIYKRINHPVEGDPGALSAASSRLDAVRQRQR